MAAMASAQTATTTLTPPSSSHGSNAWGYPNGQKQNLTYGKNNPATYGHGRRGSHGAKKTLDSYHSGIEMANQSGNSADDDVYAHHGKSDSVSSNTRAEPWGLPTPRQNGEEYDMGEYAVAAEQNEDNSKWIHRDKLAQIENEELQAAGIMLPQPRASSKQRRDRDRSRSAMRRGAEASESSNHPARSRKNSSAADPASWDARTPGEIGEGDSSNYFATNNPKGSGGSRIPVAKPKPAPIVVDNSDRGRNNNADEEHNVYSKNRSRSRSIKLLESTGANGSAQPGKRSDVSPQKKTAAGRKPAAPGKPGPSGRPKTRSGVNRDSNGNNRPNTRSGELSPNNKAPEGDPPWMVNSYKPDPRLPPDQQLLPTVARRLQQEQWEKEGKFGDVYDKEFRPLNNKDFLKLPDAQAEKGPEDEENQGGDEWPLRADAVKSPTQRSGSYSTMPKISDKPQTSPLPSPLAPATPHMPPQEQPTPKPQTQAPERVPEEPEDEKKGGCGCCVVM